MSFKFNLSGLEAIYNESLRRSEPTLAFEIVHGRGRFVFMMFFSKEDKESKDRLFVQLRNTQVFLELKAYGSHRKGDFIIYFKEQDEEAIINELMLDGGGRSFSFERFLGELNRQIPNELPLQSKLDKIREVWPQVSPNLVNVVDEADKTNLIGIRKLPEGKKPKDKTLRKLYIHTNGSAEVISNLIDALKDASVTLAWTNRDVNEVSFAELMAKINA
ncbi:hypothetical protein BGL48_15625 [Salinivibrio sp. SS3]|uniref:hypothetical protein n=1 Tax=Salinivibrio TaxID=51366 RepID=UPI000848004B|nr:MULTISPECIES: hypothetical protein [Salinivibrio]ODP97000.1 hypothetical protein BGL48_15625 [Salinivibrio sp. BNH]